MSGGTIAVAARVSPWAAPAQRGDSRGAAIKTPAANSKAWRAWVSITTGGVPARSPGERCRKIRITGSGTRWIKAARQNLAASANCDAGRRFQRHLPGATSKFAQRRSVSGDRGPRLGPCAIPVPVFIEIFPALDLFPMHAALEGPGGLPGLQMGLVGLHGPVQGPQLVFLEFAGKNKGLPWLSFKTMFIIF